MSDNEKELIRLRGQLPAKISEDWVYSAIRHWHRNCEWNDPTDGEALDRQDGMIVAQILNLIPLEPKP